MKISNNKILITGGGSGIGFALAERFVQEGNTVVICGRRLDALNEAKEKIPSLIIKQCDLAMASEREALYDWIAKEHGDLNVVVNNAGVQQWINITDDNFFENAKKEIAINIEAPLHLTTLFIKLPSLNTIMNVTSGLAFVPLTKVPIYSATKAFFHSFSLSSQVLLKAKNIEVVEIIPPALNTDLGGKGLHDFAPPVSDFIEAIFAQLKEGKTQLSFQFSEVVSKAGEEILNGAFKRMNG